MAHTLAGIGADNLAEKGFGGFIPVEDVVLAALLIVDDKLHGDPRVPGPLRMGGCAP